MIAGIVTQQVFDQILANQCPHASMCDFLELRYDTFHGRDWATLVGQLRQALPDKKVIGTIRLKGDGGEFPDDNFDSFVTDRIELWKAILAADQYPDWVDCEMTLCEYLTGVLRARPVKILLSAHDWSNKFNTETAARLLGRSSVYHADGVKLAVTGKDSVAEVQRFLTHTGRYELVSAFVMGEDYTYTRYDSLKQGANLAYCSLDGSTKFGMATVEEMYRH